MKSAKVFTLRVRKKPDVEAAAFSAWYRANLLASLDEIEKAVKRIRKLSGKKGA